MKGNGRPEDEEPNRTELTLGPKATRFLERIREKIGDPDDPAGYGAAISYALRLANWALDRDAEGLRIVAVSEITDEDEPWQEE